MKLYTLMKSKGKGEHKNRSPVFSPEQKLIMEKVYATQKKPALSYALGVAESEGITRQVEREAFAEDVTLDSFEKLFDKYATGNVYNPYGYFWQTHRNNCISFSKSLKVNKSAEQVFGYLSDIDNPLQSQDLKKNLWLKVKKILGDDEKVKIVKWKNEDIAYCEIAEILELKVDTVRKRYRRSIAKLRNDKGFNDWFYLFVSN